MLNIWQCSKSADPIFETRSICLLGRILSTDSGHSQLLFIFNRLVFEEAFVELVACLIAYPVLQVNEYL